MKASLYVVTALSAGVVLPVPALADSVGNCHIGAYRLRDGSVVDIGPTDSPSLRWRRFDGTTGALHQAAGGSWTSTLGWTGRPDGKTVSFAGCRSGEIRFGKVSGHRIAFHVIDSSFTSGAVKLVGRLVLPGRRSQVPIAVLIHGSETYSARDFYFLQRLLPAQGIGVFVYDKRGTGASGGAHTLDFSLLADDAVAAMREARRLAGGRAGRVGYLGTSQGGWIAPLAASRAPVDFVVVGYGLAVSPIDEDREEIELEMALKGHGPDVIAKALEVAATAEAVVASGFTDGFARFDEVRDRYKGEPWYKDLRGNLTRLLLPESGKQLRDKAESFRGVIRGVRLDYDPMPALRALEVPELWILGEDDLLAPSAETARRIGALGANGRPITLAMFPRAEHGICEYETKPDGERVDTRTSEGYYAMIRDFARDGRIRDHYGASTITRPTVHR